MKKIYFLFIALIGFNFLFSQTITRGPYMQTPTDHSNIFLWRTNVNTTATVWYGLDPNNLTNTQTSTANVTNHTVEISNLQPYTKYYYAVGYGNTQLAGADTNHYFITAPLPYTEQNIRVWATGDFGKGNQGQIDTKQSFVDYTRAENIDPDIWIWLGDNVYDDGKDSEYQSKVFALPGYSDIFSWLPFWPSPGNHDYNEVWSQNGLFSIPYTLNSINDHDGPYFDMVDVPEQAEAGGYQSTNEVYYSFDYGNTHFLSLNSEVYNISNNTVLNQMISWIHTDLTQNDKDWIVAYWHQPPYSNGSHNSDDAWEDVMKDMREKILPILESYNVDLIVCGHSHVYERSKLINGHYGYSNTLTPAMILNNSNGNRAQGNAYTKNEFANTPQGTVYAVVGNSGSSVSGVNNTHPVMEVTYNGSGAYGSLIFDIYKNELRGKYLSSTGNILDDFSIVKQNMTFSGTADTIICQTNSVDLSITTTKGSDSIEVVWMPGSLTGKTVTVTPSSTTQYTATITDLISGQVENDTVNVTVDPFPPVTPVITANGNVLTTDLGYLYRWFLDGQLIPGETNNTITVSTQGNYTVEVYNNSGCSVQSVPYTHYNLEIEAIANNTVICEGDSVEISINVIGGSNNVVVEWLSPLTTQTSYTFAPLTNQEIIAQGTDNTTGEIETDTLEIIVNPTPAQPAIVQNGTTLTADEDANWSYAWYLDGNLIPTATTNEITVVLDGIYTVIITDLNGCIALSENFNYLGTGIRNTNTSNDLVIYPNPNDGSFTIKTDKKIQAIKVYNFNGKEVFTSYTNKKDVELKNLPLGIYLLEIETNNNTYQQNFIINKL